MPVESRSETTILVAEGAHLETGEAWRSVIVFVLRDALVEISLVTYRGDDEVDNVRLSPRRLHVGLQDLARIELNYRYGMVRWDASPSVFSLEDLATDQTRETAPSKPRSPEARTVAAPVPEPRQASDARSRALTAPDSLKEAPEPDVSVESRASSEQSGTGGTPSGQGVEGKAVTRREDRAAQSLRRAGRGERPGKGIIPYGSRIADSVKNHTDQVDRGAALLDEQLQTWVQDDPGLGNVVAATAAKTALKVGVGAMHLLAETFVDPLRLGEGRAEGGWRGWGVDALRATSMMPAPKAAAGVGKGAIFVGRGVLAAAARMGLKASKSGSRAKSVRVRSRKPRSDDIDIYGQDAAPWYSLGRIRGMHRHHLVLKRIFRRCDAPRVRALEDSIPTVPLEMSEHLSQVHPALNEFLEEGVLRQASYTTREVVEILQDTSKFYRRSHIHSYADAVDTFIARNFEFY